MIGIQRFVISAVAAALVWAPSAGAQDSTAHPIPDGMEWTGFTCMSTSGCACPSDAGASFRATHCTAGGMIPFGNPLLTLIWGAGQHSWGGTTLTGGPSLPPRVHVQGCAAKPHRCPGDGGFTEPAIGSHVDEIPDRGDRTPGRRALT
jgi:hypothetical protein